MSGAPVLEVSIRVAARPEIVFPYFTEPHLYTQWMGGEATLNAVPGGTYRVQMRDGVEAIGRFVLVDPPRRVEFTWGWTHAHAVPAGSTRVVVTLEPDDGGTRVVLRHHDLPDTEQREHHRQGWDLYLHRLQQRIRGEDPGPDPNA